MVFLNNLPQHEINIFLCGGASKKQSVFRFALGDKIQSITSKHKYNVYYPELLFAEIFYGYDSKDLLTLENLLAHSANSVVIPLQSPGTFSELGAFANNDKLNKKLIIITEPKYKHSNSFIMNGPVEKLKTYPSNRILFYELKNESIKEIAYKITEASRNMMILPDSKMVFNNPLLAMIYYFIIIYLFDPIDENEISSILKKDVILDEQIISFQTSLSFLSSSGYISLIKYPYYSISSNGFKRFFRKRGYSEDEIEKLKDELESCRIDAINLTYRK
jgi:hypothetical protein